MILAFAAAVSLAACQVDRARYVLRTAPGVTAQFRPVESGPDWPSQLALRVRFAASGRSYWFLPWNGGSDDLQRLASTGDVEAGDWRPPAPDGGPRPLGDILYLAMDARYDVISHVPRRGDEAPRHLLLPELHDRTWHSHHDAAPKQMFDLVGCRP